METNSLKLVNDKYFFPKLSKMSLQDKVVLDIGCGGGNVGVNINKCARLLVNSDISLNALLRARERIANDKSVYVEADIFSLPFKDDSFDIITCYAVLHHIQDIGAVSAQIKRILKKDGVFLCFEPVGGCSWVDFWMSVFRIPERIQANIRKVYINLRDKFAKQDRFNNVLKDLGCDFEERHFPKNAIEYEEIFRQNKFTYLNVESILFELLPPRFFYSRYRFITKALFKLSAMFSRFGVSKEKGKLAIIEARK